MGRRNAIVLALFLAHEISTSSCGQQGSVASLLSQSQWARCEVVLGRITALSLNCGPARCAESCGPDGAIKEALSFNGDAALPSLVYELEDAQQSTRIVIANRTHVTILREPTPGSAVPYVHFAQPDRGNVLLAIGQGPSRRKYEAGSLWHLLLIAPEDTRQHLLPLFELLRADWQLLDATQAAEAALCRMASQSLPRQPVEELVAQLDDPCFPRRQAADRALRGLGLSTLAHLEALDPSRLTGEQRLRVRRICEELRCTTPDTPDRVAVWLGSDETLWRAWLSQGNAARRAAAETGLAVLEGKASATLAPAYPPQIRQRLAQLPAR